jgi:hypothetical protein
MIFAMAVSPDVAAGAVLPMKDGRAGTVPTAGCKDYLRRPLKVGIPTHISQECT